MSSTENETDNDVPNRSRKRQKKVDNWKVVKDKCARNSGEAYNTVKGDVLVPVRDLGPPCYCNCFKQSWNRQCQGNI